MTCIVFPDTGRLDEATVSMAAAGANNASIAYDDPIDLKAYDSIMGKAV